MGKAVAWRNLFWSLSNAMAHNPSPWNGDAVLPDLKAGQAYRVFAPDAYPRIKIMKLLWKCVGTEFGGRHELYERNNAGGWEDIRA